MKIKRRTFGRLYTGKRVDLYTLEAGELSLSVSTFGGRWVSLAAPSRAGGKTDILLGYAGFGGYAGDAFFLGSTVGRYANRIAGGAFSLGGETFSLSRNDGPNTLHGGRRGFDRQLWKAEPYTEKDGVFLRLELESPAGDMGFPGVCKTAVSYGLTGSGEIVADFRAAVEDGFSPVNLTNHAYFNLDGEGEGDILEHEVRLEAPRYLESGPDNLPTGKILPVENTPFDFLQSRTIGGRIAPLKDAAGRGGYDHCFVPAGDYGVLRPFARITGSRSGLTLRVTGTQPGFHFYTGNYLDGAAGKPGSVYGPHAGFCIEPEHFPDSPNRPEFPSCVYGSGRKYHEKTVYSLEW